MKHWYAIHTHPNGEAKAAFHLARQGFETYFPQFTRTRRHARRSETVKKPLFPRYIFVALDLARDRWLSVRSTIGVSHIICHGDQPISLPEAVVSGLRRNEDENGSVVLNNLIKFKRGESVWVVKGPLKDKIAIFDGASDQDRVSLLLDILGRQVSIVLPRDAIDASA